MIFCFPSLEYQYYVRLWNCQKKNVLINNNHVYRNMQKYCWRGHLQSINNNGVCKPDLRERYFCCNILIPILVFKKNSLFLYHEYVGTLGRWDITVLFIIIFCVHALTCFRIIHNSCLFLKENEFSCLVFREKIENWHKELYKFWFGSYCYCSIEWNNLKLIWIFQFPDFRTGTPATPRTPRPAFTRF